LDPPDPHSVPLLVIRGMLRGRKVYTLTWTHGTHPVSRSQKKSGATSKNVTPADVTTTRDTGSAGPFPRGRPAPPQTTVRKGDILLFLPARGKAECPLFPGRVGGRAGRPGKRKVLKVSTWAASTGGSGKAVGFAQALPMATGETIGKLRRLRLPLPPNHVLRLCDCPGPGDRGPCQWAGPCGRIAGARGRPHETVSESGSE